MAWDDLIPFDSHETTTHIVYLFLGVFILLFGLYSHFIKDRLFMSEAFVATIFGIIVGPYALKLFDPKIDFEDTLYQVLLEVSRLVVGIQCMASGIALPGNYVWRSKLSIMVLLGPLMLAMWLVSSMGAKLIFGVSWTDAFVIGACVTPTDPVLANSVVRGAFAEAHIPPHVRLLLSAESAANDGLALAFLLLPIYTSRMMPAQGVWLWLLKVVLYQVVLAILLGILIGTGARYLLKYSQKHKYIDKESLLSFSIALALAILGSLSLLGVDDILGAFTAGLALSWDSWINTHIEESRIQEVIDSLLNFTYFIFFGTLIPWAAFQVDIASIQNLVMFSLWILFLRRLPATVLLSPFIPVLKTRKEIFFFGWFGPIGASAVFYACFCIVVLAYPIEPLFLIVCFVVLSSVVVHGGTVSFFHFGINSWRNASPRRDNSPVRDAVEMARLDGQHIEISATV